MFAAHEFWKLRNRSNLDIQVFTFGQAKIGNRQFAQILNQAQGLNQAQYIKVRVTHTNDYVSQLPMSHIDYNYAHTMIELWIESDCDCKVPEAFLCNGPMVNFPDGSFQRESEECNLRKQIQPSFDPHNGPYFGVEMGYCSIKPPPCSSRTNSIKDIKRNFGVAKELLKEVGILSTLRKYAWYASLAYCLDEDKGFQIQFDKGTKIYASYLAEEHYLIIFIRGKKMRKYDWLTMPVAWMDYPIAGDGAKVEKELYTTYLSTRSKIIEITNNLMNSPNTDIVGVVFVGHALGGVYAVFAALEYYNQLNPLYKTVQVFTYGQPRIGNKKFAHYINENKNLFVFRVTYKDDYVPRLPTNINMEAFMHYSPEYWIAQDDCECNKVQVFRCLGSVENEGQVAYREEDQNCNAQFNLPNLNSNWGPYFGTEMGICSDKPPSWLAV
ncbi:hypothetical protein G9A89_010616 [Geosiphon pyriformis]|nr:hypothetical protein G9A89_010616 [Geosiphon pyriformis]